MFYCATLKAMRDVMFSIRIPAPMLVELNEICKMSHRKRNDVINLMLEERIPKVLAELKAAKTAKKTIV